MLMTYDSLQAIREVLLLTCYTDLLHQYDSPYDLRSLPGE